MDTFLPEQLKFWATLYDTAPPPPPKPRKPRPIDETASQVTMTPWGLVVTDRKLLNPKEKKLPGAPRSVPVPRPNKPQQPLSSKPQLKTETSLTFPLPNISPRFNLDQSLAPYFPSVFDVARSDILYASSKGAVVVVQAHVGYQRGRVYFRVFQACCTMTDSTSSPLAISSRVWFPATSSSETREVYRCVFSHFRLLSFEPFSFASLSSQLLAIHHPKFSISPTVTLPSAHNSSNLDRGVGTLVDLLFREARAAMWSLMGGQARVVNDGLETPFGLPALEKIEQAQTSVREISETLKGCSRAEIESTIDTVSNLLPGVPRVDASNLPEVAKWLEEAADILCMLKDAVDVDENVDDIMGDTTPQDILYKSLRTTITPLQKADPRREEVVARFQKLHTEFRVHEVYQLQREQDPFELVGTNVQLLFHGSKNRNLVSILTKGLLPPAVIVSLGGTRSDHGFLGRGVYFAASPDTSLRYTAPGISNTRTILLASVELGKVLETAKQMPQLTGAPTGFDSVMGVGSLPSLRSEFAATEYAVYNPAQIKLEYLVEFSCPGDAAPLTLQAPPSSANKRKQADTEVGMVGLAQVTAQILAASQLPTDVPAPKRLKGDYGLVADDKVCVFPLQEVHVRARVTDLVAKVSIYQVYTNEQDHQVEAKYKFPLDAMAAVCGFEAYINGKHVIGVVKEKEEAKKEYKEAIAQGHGAYLMEEDTEGEIFTVTVGNLPAKAKCMIKITYVTELATTGKLSSLMLPQAVSPRQASRAANEGAVTGSLAKGLTVVVGIECPSRIINLQCSEHRARVLTSGVRGCVTLSSPAVLPSDIVINIQISNFHVPRMWTEIGEVGQPRAVMVAMFPDLGNLDTAPRHLDEIVFVVDRSSSMKGDGMASAVQLLLAFLHRLEVMLTETMADPTPTPSPDVKAAAPPKAQPQPKFNILSFGSTIDRLFVDSETLSFATLQRARQYVGGISANFGSSEAWRPLQETVLLSSLLSSAPVASAATPPAVILISDGQYPDPSLAFAALKQHVGAARVLPCAVGPRPSRLTLEAIARLGGGKCETVLPGESMASIMEIAQRQLSRASQHALTHIEVEWMKASALDVAVADQAPKSISSLFHEDRQIVYAFVPFECTGVRLTAMQGSKRVEFEVRQQSEFVTKDPARDVIRKLTAKAVIRDYDSGMFDSDRVTHELAKRKRKLDVIRLGCVHCLVTPFTSFIAIEKRAEGDVVSINPSVWDLMLQQKVDPYFGTEPALAKSNRPKETKRAVSPVRSDPGSADLSLEKLQMDMEIDDLGSALTSPRSLEMCMLDDDELLAAAPPPPALAASALPQLFFSTRQSPLMAAIPAPAALAPLAIPQARMINANLRAFSAPNEVDQLPSFRTSTVTAPSQRSAVSHASIISHAFVSHARSREPETLPRPLEALERPKMRVLEMERSVEHKMEKLTTTRMEEPMMALQAVRVEESVMTRHMEAPRMALRMEEPKMALQAVRMEEPVMARHMEAPRMALRMEEPRMARRMDEPVMALKAMKMEELKPVLMDFSVKPVKMEAPIQAVEFLRVEEHPRVLRVEESVMKEARTMAVAPILPRMDTASSSSSSRALSLDLPVTHSEKEKKKDAAQSQVKSSQPQPTAKKAPSQAQISKPQPQEAKPQPPQPKSQPQQPRPQPQQPSTSLQQQSQPQLSKPQPPQPPQSQQSHQSQPKQTQPELRSEKKSKKKKQKKSSGNRPPVVISQGYVDSDDDDDGLVDVQDTLVNEGRSRVGDTKTTTTTVSATTGGLEVNMLPLGVTAADGLMHVLIPKATRLPYTASHTFTTDIRNQTSVDVRVNVGESPVALDNLQLVNLMYPIEPARAGAVNITIKLEMRTRNSVILTVSGGKSTVSHALTVPDSRLEAPLVCAALSELSPVHDKLPGLPNEKPTVLEKLLHQVYHSNITLEDIGPIVNLNIQQARGMTEKLCNDEEDALALCYCIVAVVMVVLLEHCLSSDVFDAFEDTSDYLSTLEPPTSTDLCDAYASLNHEGHVTVSTWFKNHMKKVATLKGAEPFKDRIQSTINMFDSNRSLREWSCVAACIIDQCWADDSNVSVLRDASPYNPSAITWSAHWLGLLNCYNRDS